MPIIPKDPYPKKSGDAILSRDWNQVVDEVIRLGTVVTENNLILTKPLKIETTQDNKYLVITQEKLGDKENPPVPNLKISHDLIKYNSGVREPKPGTFELIFGYTHEVDIQLGGGGTFPGLPNTGGGGNFPGLPNIGGGVTSPVPPNTGVGGNFPGLPNTGGGGTPLVLPKPKFVPQLSINQDGDIDVLGGNINVSKGALSFGATCCQKITLYNKNYGIGIQNNTQYFRTEDQFAWFKGGVHSNTKGDPGDEGICLMQLGEDGFRLMGLNVQAYKPGGGAWSAASDRRLKDNIQPLNGALERLLQLRGVTFQWKEPEKHADDTGLQIGLVAQEVENVFPKWVTTGPDGYKYVGVTGFEALTIEAFRELNEKVDRLEARLTALEQRGSVP